MPSSVLTEEALRRFQLNLGLPSDGIAGAYTYAALRSLAHSWVGKATHSPVRHLGFARAPVCSGATPCAVRHRRVLGLWPHACRTWPRP
ncbi:MAG: peptidoglycan-binding domain-containing protein [Eggerthella lenta]